MPQWARNSCKDVVESLFGPGQLPGPDSNQDAPDSVDGPLEPATAANRLETGFLSCQLNVPIEAVCI